jgi:two-component system sensor histidine kinase ChvG
MNDDVAHSPGSAVSKEPSASSEPPVPPEGRAQPSSLSSLGGTRLPHVFSRLGLKVLVFNLFLIVLVVSVFFATDNSREQLVQGRIDAMQIQAELIARSFASETVVDEESTDIMPEKSARMMRIMVSPTDVRARLYTKTGRLLTDSKLLGSGTVESFDLGPLGEDDTEGWFNPLEGLYDLWIKIFFSSSLPEYREYANQPGTDFYEVVEALEGQTATARRQNSEGELVVSVAVPIRRFKIVLGVLLVTAEGGDIDRMIREDRLQTLTYLGYGLLVVTLLSLYFSFYIVRPIRRLARTADEAVTGTNFARVEIPDLSVRNDEIGDLSVSFRRLIRALYTRIEAIESFAADVAHEIKNPLTSIRSAVETLEIVKDDKAKETLLGLIVEDVGRLDRLISDISDASRLDAELVREATEPLDLAALLTGLHEIYEATRRDDAPHIKLNVVRDPAVPGQRFTVNGLEDRLGQVFRNLINNAVSFSQADDVIEVTTFRRHYQGQDVVCTVVEDTGPGIPQDNLESIFQRFYTERPDGDDFGKNSGLGLSISRQIVEMLDGKIWAENRLDAVQNEVVGARFVVILPVRRDEATAKGLRRGQWGKRDPGDLSRKEKETP